MIVATAGHVDHGKTSLVRALTGVDTDRTAEEKRRGMSIDLGFAYHGLGGTVPIGFVDVPGHERFVRNMLAGVGAVDLVLLVVAADDGPMPQTREHLALLDLLGVPAIAVVVTKIDRVPAERAQAVAAEAAALLRRYGRHPAALLTLSVAQGVGVDALGAFLRRHAAALPARSTGGLFRLAVDRSFHVAGAGLVATGAVLSGRCVAGDRLLLLPQGLELRARGLHADGRAAAQALAGQRCAINLAGSDARRAEVARGSWLVAPGAAEAATRLDLRLQLPAEAARPLRDGAALQLHIGAATRQARVALLQGRELPPGHSGLAQLVLDQPVHAVHGDRLLLRDPSARLLCGGRVIDPQGAARGRARPLRLRQLLAAEAADDGVALQRLLAADPAGVLLGPWAQARNRSRDDMHSVVQTLGLCTVDEGDAQRIVDAGVWESVQMDIVQALARWHAGQPERLGPDVAELAAAASVPAPLFRPALRRLVQSGRVCREPACLRLPGHRPALRPEDVLLLERLLPLLRARGVRPPVLGELCVPLGLQVPALAAFLQRATAAGCLVHVGRNRFFLPEAIEHLRALAERLAGAGADGSFDAAAFRDASGIGRNLTVEVLEFFDRSRFTRYDGARRRLLRL